MSFGSVCGAMLLVGGLYCVLWGKNKEAKSEEEAAKCHIPESDMKSIEEESQETTVVRVLVVDPASVMRGTNVVN